MIENRQKLIVAKRPLQMYALEREVTPFVETAGIAKITDRKRASKNFDAIAGARQRRRSRVRFLGIGSDAQASVNRDDAQRGFDALKIDLVSHPPGKRQ